MGYENIKPESRPGDSVAKYAALVSCLWVNVLHVIPYRFYPHAFSDFYIDIRTGVSFLGRAGSSTLIQCFRWFSSVPVWSSPIVTWNHLDGLHTIHHCKVWRLLWSLMAEFYDLINISTNTECPYYNRHLDSSAYVSPNYKSCWVGTSSTRYPASRYTSTWSWDVLYHIQEVAVSRQLCSELAWCMSAFIIRPSCLDHICH